MNPNADASESAARSKPRPHVPPISLTTVWECDDPQQADSILGRRDDGYVYRREANPNADGLAAACRKWHGVEFGTATASGMAAISAAILATLQAGDHLLLSDRLYGNTTYVAKSELSRLGITCTTVDMTDLAATVRAMTSHTRLLLAETIANPRLEVTDIAALAEIAEQGGAKLLIDNTFASPYVCRPAALGAHLVMESLTKIMNGHSDVLLGFLGGSAAACERVAKVVTAWGFAASPFDCWLAERGLGTLELRLERACNNALRAAEFLSSHPAVASVDFPGLVSHPQHALASKQFNGRFGHMVTFHLRDGLASAERFIARVKEHIPFCPSLGTLYTSLSHPESTSHRGLTAEQRTTLGIGGGTIRLSVGTEPGEELLERLNEGLVVGQALRS